MLKSGGRSYWTTEVAFRSSVWRTTWERENRGLSNFVDSLWSLGPRQRRSNSNNWSRALCIHLSVLSCSHNFRTGSVSWQVSRGTGRTHQESPRPREESNRSWGYQHMSGAHRYCRSHWSCSTYREWKFWRYTVPSLVTSASLSNRTSNRHLPPFSSWQRRNVHM